MGGAISHEDKTSSIPELFLRVRAGVRYNFAIKHRDLFFARAYYFASAGGSGFISPFINLYYVSLGLSGTQIGTVTSASALVGLIFAPIIVSEIKKQPRARGLLQGALFLSAVGYFVLGHQTSYLPILITVFLQALAISSISPISDSMAVSVSQSAGSGYGSVRVFASLGWIVAVLASGWLIERFDFIAGFIGVSTMLILGAGLIVFIQPHHFAAHSNAGFPKPGLRTALRRVLHDRLLLGFAVCLVCIGFANSGVTQFENVFLEELGASKQLISVAGILSAIVELPFMIYADRFVRRQGADRIFFLAILATSLQRSVVLIFPSIAAIMLMRFIGGMAFSLYTVSYIGLISSRTDPDETGTVLALYTVTLASLVNILAAPISGAIYDAIGTRWLYALAAGGYLLGAFFLWMGRRSARDTNLPPFEKIEAI